MDEIDLQYLGITKNVFGQTCVIEHFLALSSGLYWTKINAIETHGKVNKKFTDSNTFILWHDRLRNPGSLMMRRIIENSNGYPLKDLKILLNGEFSCTACYQGKLIVRPSPTKVEIESPTFLERMHGDICGPIHPPSTSFRYFMVLTNVSSKWFYVRLNLAFAKLLA